MKKKQNQNNNSEQILLAHDIKPSYHRLMIFNYINNNMQHPTVDEVYRTLARKIPTLSKTTIYNTLSLFVDKKLISAIGINDHELRYDYNIKDHIHFKCTHCGRIIDIQCRQDKFFKQKKINGHTICECSIYYKGICKNCRGKGKKEFLP